MTPVDAALTTVSMFVAGYYAKRMLEIGQIISGAFPHLATELTILSVGLLMFAALACLAATKARAGERQEVGDAAIDQVLKRVSDVRQGRRQNQDPHR